MIACEAAFVECGTIVRGLKGRRARWTGCATFPPPTSVDETVRLASQSVNAALQAGQRRVRVDAIIPGLNVRVEETYPYSSATLNTVALQTVLNTDLIGGAQSCTLLFPSAGAAAAAATQYRRDGVTLPEGVRTGSFSDTPSEHANVLVAPVATRGDPLLPLLEGAVASAPQAVWMLLNADLSADRAAVGMRESARRARFEDSFERAFYFRNVFMVKRPTLRAVEKGALLFCYGAGWSVFALQTDGYELVKRCDKMPSVEELTSVVSAASARNVSRSRAAENAGADAAFLRTIAGSAALVAAVLAALRLRAGS
ncbi:hypothetical protein BWQ96_08742 [Gracilariopsis chorda]|uniref:DUF1995 domain-containing protein n=1 Tax=Gracilariopsis chorda TaxID=448386 RepID=A0A2V3IHK1_9FLOR|nr:hypothetical protein BWQ96_08742 [Gracilariopsis chorda]|eukprot:PXF41539.1 hypothetical protein BWQ96_08742 [Gracilariopsis chorda]